MSSKRKTLKNILPRLEQLLARTKPFGGMSIEQLDGFITASVCTSRKYSILSYLPFVMGKTAHPDVYSPKEWKEFQGLLTALDEYRVDNFRKMELIIRPDSEGNITGQKWASGFGKYSRLETSWNTITSVEFWNALGLIYMLWTGTTLPEDETKAVPLTQIEKEDLVNQHLRQAIRLIWLHLYENNVEPVEPPDANVIWDKLMRTHYIEATNATH